MNKIEANDFTPIEQRVAEKVDFSGVQIMEDAEVVVILAAVTLENGESTIVIGSGGSKQDQIRLIGAAAEQMAVDEERYS